MPLRPPKILQLCISVLWRCAVSYRNSNGEPRKRIVEWLGRVDGGGRKAADEKYRAVLRENVYLYGKGRPGERYAREAAAREEFRDIGNDTGTG
jgi:hypothetical protein